MLPNMQCPQLTSTQVDAKLLGEIKLDEFTLRRARKEFETRYNNMSYGQKKDLAEGGALPRFVFMDAILCETLNATAWANWLTYLDHSEEDMDEMRMGEYPISPYMIRFYSAFFGIKVDFMLLGRPPEIDKVGGSINRIPL